jgi:hypothetical protein
MEECLTLVSSRYIYHGSQNLLGCWPLNMEANL